MGEGWRRRARNGEGGGAWDSFDRGGVAWHIVEAVGPLRSRRVELGCGMLLRGTRGGAGKKARTRTTSPPPPRGGGGSSLAPLARPPADTLCTDVRALIFLTGTLNPTPRC